MSEQLPDTEQPSAKPPRPVIGGYTALLIALSLILLAIVLLAWMGHPDLAEKLISVVPWSASVSGGPAAGAPENPE